MDKHQVAQILDEIGTLLEIQGENPFRCNAYHVGARAIENLSVSLDELIAEGRLAEVEGIGKTLSEKIITLVRTGQLPFYEELRARTPPGLVEMLRLPGIGPKKVKALYEQLGIDTLDKLKAACEAGQVAGLRGFGAKTQQKLLDGLAFLGTVGNRVRLDKALAIAELLLEGLRGLPGIQRMEVCGSLRRRKETCADIDVLVSAEDAGPIMEAFTKLPLVMQVVAHGPTKSSVVIADGPSTERVVMNADLRIVRDEQFPFALHYFTGSKEHNIAMRQRAQDRGLKLNEYELAGLHQRIAAKDEADIFRALDLDYIPPELREHTGEIAAAEAGRLPVLVQLDDLQGTFHCHTTASDGRSTLEEMAQAARALGLKYLGIADHSQTLTVANGLSPERVRRQQAEIDALNASFRGFRIFKGTECDILPDGRLDFDEELLATFDYVVASVHSHFNMSQEEMTARIVRALSHPAVTMLGHATGRLLLRREGYKVDLEAVLKAAAQHGKMIEINAQPSRMELDWVHCKRAKELGIPLVINPDAHSTSELELLRYGVYVAQRGWLEKKDVFNTASLAQVTKTLAARKKAAGLGQCPGK
jgi:DNA polymerase (family 10)